MIVKATVMIARIVIIIVIIAMIIIVIAKIVVIVLILIMTILLIIRRRVKQENSATGILGWQQNTRLNGQRSLPKSCKCGNAAATHGHLAANRQQLPNGRRVLDDFCVMLAHCCCLNLRT